jgi:DNA-directed RNA polymerase subunit H
MSAITSSYQSTSCALSFERYKVQAYQLPRITAQDPAIRHLGVKVGDVIRITRSSETAGEAVFYRIVSSE